MIILSAANKKVSDVFHETSTFLVIKFVFLLSSKTY